jgi:hypothetical protein
MFIHAGIDVARTAVQSWGTSLDQALPNFSFQTAIDETIQAAEASFLESSGPAALWLNTTPKGSLLTQVFVLAATFPMRILCNFFVMLLKLVKAVVYVLTHPLQSIFKGIDLFLQFVEKFTEAKTWTIMGAGFVGASIGQCAVGNPFSLPMLTIGLVMMVIGLVAGGFSAAWVADAGEGINAALTECYEHLIKLPAALATGFLTGLIVGGIQHSVHEAHQLAQAKQMGSWLQDDIGGKIFVSHNHALQFASVSYDGGSYSDVFDLGEIPS